MTASSVTGKGGGASGKLTTKELSALAVGPAIYAAGVAAISDLLASPPTEGSTNSVTLPIPLVGGADAYVVLLTTLNGGKAYVTSMDDDGDGNFVSFDVSVEADCDVMYMVVKKGFRPSIK